MKILSLISLFLVMGVEVMQASNNEKILVFKWAYASPQLVEKFKADAGIMAYYKHEGEAAINQLMSYRDQTDDVSYAVNLDNLKGAKALYERLIETRVEELKIAFRDLEAEKKFIVNTIWFIVMARTIQAKYQRLSAALEAATVEQ